MIKESFSLLKGIYNYKTDQTGILSTIKKINSYTQMHFMFVDIALESVTGIRDAIHIYRASNQLAKDDVLLAKFQSEVQAIK